MTNPSQARFFPAPDSIAGIRLDALNTLVANIRREEKNVDLWFGVWETNKDYSGVMNASFAIGKLGSLVDTAMFSFADVNKDVLPYLEELSEKNRQNMGAISANVGRIIPYRSGSISM